MASIEVKLVESKRDLDAFIRLPWKIYADQPNWVPPLIMDMKKLLDQRKNPFFEHSTAVYFLALRNGEAVGRVAAIHNTNHNAFHNENIGFFGFFEAIADREVARALLQQAEAWVRDHRLQAIRGPMNFSTNDTCGMLIEGFEHPPMVMMPYNPPYYNVFLEELGYQKAEDLLAHRFRPETEQFNERIARIAAKARQQTELTVRSINMRNFKQEIATIKSIYNDAWSHNWGFVPMTDAEFEHLAKDLKPVVQPRLALIAEIDGEPAAFSLSLPDFNQALIKINGRLLPFGLLKVLYYSKKIDAIRVLTLGVRKKFEKSRGIAPILYEETFRRGLALGFTWAEFSWVLESNRLMNSPLQLIGGEVYKRYRVYEKQL